jgi:Mesyanzhinovviridae DNA primase
MMRGIPTAPYWLAHPDRRQYEGLDIVPNGPAVLPNGYLNLWRGWGVDPKPGSWKLLRRHVEEVLANGSQVFADYMLRLTAWKFQNPGKPPEVVLAFLGGKGSGKGVWGYTLMKIFGSHGLQIFSTNHLTGKHNVHLQNKLFLFLDEAIWAGDTAADRVLKGMTTEKWMLIEPKNVDAFQWPNRLAMLMSGNAKWIVPASHDERRYAVNRINEKWKQNKTYFTPLFEEINNGGAGAMLHDLLQLDLNGWHPRENVPQTKTLLEQKQLGLTGFEQWWCHLISVGELPKPDKKNQRYVISEYLLEDAKNQNPRNKFLTADELGRSLRDMGCTHKSNGKKWGWVFPPLTEAREAWRAQSGSEWEWLAPEIEEWGEKPASEGGLRF